MDKKKEKNLLCLKGKEESEKGDIMQYYVNTSYTKKKAFKQIKESSYNAKCDEYRQKLFNDDINDNNNSNNLRPGL
jgi:hypothetical protein